MGTLMTCMCLRAHACAAASTQSDRNSRNGWDCTKCMAKTADSQQATLDCGGQVIILRRHTRRGGRAAAWHTLAWWEPWHDTGAPIPQWTVPRLPPGQILVLCVSAKHINATMDDNHHVNNDMIRCITITCSSIFFLQK